MLQQADEVLGIDFGTSKSVVAALHNGDSEVLENALGKRSTPSCVFIQIRNGEECQREVGEGALQQAISSPQNIIFGVKQLLGRTISEMKNEVHPLLQKNESRVGNPVIWLDPLHFLHLEEAASMIIRDIKVAAEEKLKKKCTNAVLSVPAYFNAGQREAIADSAFLAGLDVVQLINDTSAIALNYAQTQDSKIKRTIFVIDIGGGGGSVSLIRLDGRDLHTLASSGTRLPGGRDLDLKMIEYLKEIVKQNYGKEVNDLRCTEILHHHWEIAKKKLSRIPTASIKTYLPTVNIDLKIEISQSDFHRECSELFERIVTELGHVLRMAKVTINDVDVVLLSGGSTRVPYLRTLIQSTLQGKHISRATNPDEAVAQGAALVSAGYFSIHEVTPLRLSIELSSGSHIVIQPNTKLPYVENISPSSKILSIEQGFSQSQGTALIRKNSFSEIEVHGLQIDESGRLNFSTAHEKRTKLNFIGCLSSVLLLEIRNKVQVMLAREKDENSRIEAKNALESICRNLQIDISSEISRGTIESFEGQPMLHECDSRLSWLEKYPRATITEIKEATDVLQRRAGDLNRFIEFRKYDVLPRTQKSNHFTQWNNSALPANYLPPHISMPYPGMYQQQIPPTGFDYDPFKFQQRYDTSAFIDMSVGHIPFNSMPRFASVPYYRYEQRQLPYPVSQQQPCQWPTVQRLQNDCLQWNLNEKEAGFSDDYKARSQEKEGRHSDEGNVLEETLTRPGCSTSKEETLQVSSDHDVHSPIKVDSSDDSSVHEEEKAETQDDRDFPPVKKSIEEILIDYLQGNVYGEIMTPQQLGEEVKDETLSSAQSKQMNEKIEDSSDSETEDGSNNGWKGSTFYQNIFNYITKKNYPAAMKGDRNAKSNFRKQCRSFRVENNKLLHKTHVGKKSYQGRDNETFPEYALVITNKEEQQKLIKLVHEGSDSSLEAKALSGHRGQKTSIDILSRRVWWPGFTADVANYINSCDACQRVNEAALKVKAPLHSVPPPRENLKQIGIDIITLPEVDGFKYVVVCVDYLSKFCHAKSLTTKSAPEVARFILEWICLFGCPAIIINDQGREFCNAVADELLKLTGVTQRVTSAYNPQANGQVERENRIIKSRLLKVLRKRIHEWPSVLDPILFGIRTQKQKSTGYSPFYLLFGQEPQLPIDVHLSNHVEDADDPDSESDEQEDITIDYYLNRYSNSASEAENCEEGLENFVENWMDMRSQVLSKAHKNIKNAQKIQRDEYNARHDSGKVFKVGEKVLKKNLRRRDRKGDWIQEPWSGPYIIVNISSTGGITLENLQTKQVLAKAERPQNLKSYNERGNSDTAVEEALDIDKKRPTHAKNTRQKTLKDNKKVMSEQGNSGLMEEKVKDLQKQANPKKKGKKVLTISSDDSDNNVQDPPVVTNPKAITEEEIEEILLLPEERVVVERYKIPITVKDLLKMNTNAWFTDEMVNFYFNLLEEKYNSNQTTKVHVFNTFFYPKMEKSLNSVKQWTKNVDIFEKNLLLIPIIQSAHWTLCIVRPQDFEIVYYDSMKGKNEKCLQDVHRYLKSEFKAKKGGTLKQQDFSMKYAEDILQQRDSYNCGAFICFYGRRLCEGGSCKEDNIDGFRCQIIREIVSCTILPDNFVESLHLDMIRYPRRVLYSPSCTVSTNFKIGAGLRNLGNTCFMNSSLQAIFHCEAFWNFLGQDSDHRASCSESNCIHCSLAKVFFGCQKRDPFEPRQFLETVKAFWRDFQQGTQQDAQEFLSLLFLAMQNEYLKRFPKLLIDCHSRETTPINSIFGTYLRTEVRCTECTSVSTTLVVAHMLSIPVTLSLVDSLKEFTSEETVHCYKCPECKQEVSATKRICIEKTPHVLVLHIKRFTALGDKISQKMVTKEKLDMQPYMHQDTKEVKNIFNIKGCVTHVTLGETKDIASGHYVTTVRHKRHCYQFNDATVNQTSMPALLDAEAYLLFYTKDDAI